nr:MAG TPA: hypothetical protein [Caudoviricetes sp.]
MQLLNHFKILGAVCPTLMRLIRWMNGHKPDNAE